MLINNYIQLNLTACVCVLEPNWKVSTANDDVDDGHYKEYSSGTERNAVRRSCRICTMLLLIAAIYLQAQLMKIYQQLLKN